MLLDKLETLIENIIKSSEIRGDLVPVELIDMLDPSSASDSIGDFILTLRKKDYVFSADLEEVSSYEEAFERVKSSSSKEEQIYYALLFLSGFNKVTKPSVVNILKIILG